MLLILAEQIQKIVKQFFLLGKIRTKEKEKRYKKIIKESKKEKGKCAQNKQ